MCHGQKIVKKLTITLLHLQNVLLFCWDWSIWSCFTGQNASKSHNSTELLTEAQQKCILSSEGKSFVENDSKWDAAIYWFRDELQLQIVDGTVTLKNLTDPLLYDWLESFSENT